MKALGPVSPSQTHVAITERAADFVERRRFGRWDDADRAELDAWLAESFLHHAAYFRLDGASAHTEHLIARHPGAFAQDASVGGNKIMRRRFVLPLLAAASVALFAALGIPFVNSLLQEPDRTYATEVGGRTLLKFADGTLIDMNTETVLRFRMTNAERKVWLERGEAWFHVSHNAANPFIVFVGRHRVTDLGTEFLIRRGSESMEVALLAGRASLSADGAPIAMLTPGQDAVATPLSLSVVRKTPQQLADELAWRRGILVFRKTKLGDVAREFNRYNMTKLVIADPAVADKTITANARTDDYETILRLAEVELNLRVDREGNEILISRETKKPGRHSP